VERENGKNIQKNKKNFAIVWKGPDKYTALSNLHPPS